MRALLVLCSASLLLLLPATASAQGPSASADGRIAAAGPSSAEPVHVVRDGTLRIRVKDLAEHRAALQTWLRIVDGYIAAQEPAVNGAQAFTLRVPSDKLQAVMDSLAASAIEVVQHRASGQDVSAEVQKLQDLLRSKRQAERRYADVLAQARVAGDLLTLEERYDQLRREIQEVQSDLRRLTHATRYGTLHVLLVEAGPSSA